MRKLLQVKRYKIIIGKKIRSWTVIDDKKTGTNKHPRVLCQCKCGIKKNVDLDNLINEKTNGCRKCSSDRFVGNNNPSWSGYKDVPGEFYGILKRSALSRKIDVFVSINDIQELWENQNGLCALSGIKLKLSSKKSGCTASIDRINPKVGYVVGNIQFVHKHINWMKNKFSNEYYLEMCKKVYFWNSDRNKTIEKCIAYGS